MNHTSVGYMNILLIRQTASTRSLLVIMMSERIFENMPVPVCPVRHRLCRAPPDPPRHHERATLAPHISPRCPRRKNCRRCPTRRAGAVERRPPGDNRSLPGKGVDPRERRGSQHFRRPFPPGVATTNFRQLFHAKFNIPISIYKSPH